MKITYSDQIRGGILSGIDRLGETVKVTLGPAGRNVAIYQKKNIRDAASRVKDLAGVGGWKIWLFRQEVSLSQRKWA